MRDFGRIGQYDGYVDVQRRYMIYHLFSPPFKCTLYNKISIQSIDSLVNISFSADKVNTKTLYTTGWIGEVNP